jgi:hypothetical protein
MAENQLGASSSVKKGYSPLGLVSCILSLVGAIFLALAWINWENYLSTLPLWQQRIMRTDPRFKHGIYGYYEALKSWKRSSSIALSCLFISAILGVMGLLGRKRSAFLPVIGTGSSFILVIAAVVVSNLISPFRFVIFY